MLFQTDDKVSLLFQIITVALAIAIAVLGVAYGAWTMFASQMTDGDGYTASGGVDINSGQITEPDKQIISGLAPDKEGVVHKDELTSLQENIMAWANTGVAAKSNDVTNILLIGIDVESKNMQTNSRADAMVMFSLNHKTKTITLASIMRDQYSYIEWGTHKKFEKLHHANAYGGPKAQIEVLEKYYKVVIDNYALVNFYSLPKIIDSLGGVNVEITKTEADYMNTYWGTSVSVGANTLSGEDALIYMRIRHQTGGDEARVLRQQTVIKEILNKLKQFDKAKLLSVIGELVPYIRTGYNSNQMLSLAADALTNGWFDYKLIQTSFPNKNCAGEFTVKENGNKVWYWKVDYPLAAQELQKLLYGTTNISLDKDRKSWLG